MEDRCSPLPPTVLPYPTGRLCEFYSIGKEIGRGHFGVVRECRCIFTGAEFACKSVDKSKLKTKIQVSELRMEIAAMRELGSHPGIVQLQQAFEDERYVHIVMEKCEGGDLYEYIRSKRRLTEVEAAAILKQIAEAVSFCHSRGILHRDLKPENIFITSCSLVPSVKIGDFGLAVRMDPERFSSGVVGSIYYMAPEVLRRTRYGSPADVWSLGIVLFASLCGYLPFWGKDHEEACASILKAEIDFSKSSWNKVSCSARDLVSSMLSLDTCKRLSLEEVLIHPWFSLFPQLSLLRSNSPDLMRVPRKREHVPVTYTSFTSHQLADHPRSRGPGGIRPKPLKQYPRPVEFTQEELTYLKTTAQVSEEYPQMSMRDKSSSLDLNSSPKSVIETHDELH